MNEYSIFTYLLTRTDGDTRGATEAEILKALHLPTKFGKMELQKKMADYDTYIHPLGMQVKFNPMDNRWFVAYQQDLVELTGINPFAGKPRLAATLLAILICALKYGRTIPVAAINEIRPKKSLMTDLKDLQRSKYIQLVGSDVELTPLVGYQLDVTSLFEKINELVRKPAGGQGGEK